LNRLTVAKALARAKECGVDRLDAQLLLTRVLVCPRSWVLAHDDAELEATASQTFLSHLARRSCGEPLAYLLGEKEFRGLTLHVNSSVLVPRPDTELLVDWALELLQGVLAVARPKVLDLGTGSGAIALAIKQTHSSASITAFDASPAALEVARANAQRLDLDVTFGQGSWWQSLQGQRFHLVVSNPPYIAAADPHLDALAHEPRLALTPGGDGLGALHEIIDGAPGHLEPGGWLLLEHGFDQGDAVRSRLTDLGFLGVQTRCDLAGQPRCTGAHL
jgi:release factor glutamine methyltransferase